MSINRLRSVNTKFWEDPYIEGLKPEEKLLFLYFLTNPLTNMLGIYEISIKRMSYDTGLTEERIRKALKGFDGKIYYIQNYIILPNFLKNQNLNTNMKTGVLKLWDDLPNELKHSISDKPLKAFESIRNTLLNMNMNNEGEIEGEIEGESDIKVSKNCLFKNSGVTVEDIKKAFLATDDIRTADSKYYYNAVLDWSSGSNKMKTDWIATARNFARKDLKDGKMKTSTTERPYRPDARILT